jgi:peptidoglycan hydrolase-like amidase
VAAEMYPDWPEIGYWGYEALKAQAVAARSYAVFRLTHPRTPEFDMYGDARDQAYNPDKWHPKSDEAVRNTEPLIVTTNSPAFVARYVNKCGREDCPFCQGIAGFGGATWNDRMCQFGAGELARQGKTYGEILKHYYGDSAEIRRIDE